MHVPQHSLNRTEEGERKAPTIYQLHLHARKENAARSVFLQKPVHERKHQPSQENFHRLPQFMHSQNVVIGSSADRVCA
jgi:hypothetical protein